MNTIYFEDEGMPSEHWEQVYGQTNYEGTTPEKDGKRTGQKLAKYKSHCWSKRVKAGSPHWHIILTKEGETFAFWATGWRQLVYKSDTFDFKFNVSKAKHTWAIIDLPTLVVRDRNGNEIDRGGGDIGFKEIGWSRKYA
mgnify:FL=1